MKHIHLDFAHLWFESAPKARTRRHRAEFERLMWLELLLWVGVR